jgi:hypothetical protein
MRGLYEGHFPLVLQLILGPLFLRIASQLGVQSTRTGLFFLAIPPVVGPRRCSWVLYENQRKMKNPKIGKLKNRKSHGGPRWKKIRKSKNRKIPVYGGKNPPDTPHT